MRIGIQSFRHLSLFLASALVTSLCFASTAKSLTYHYQLSIPNGWEQVSASQLAELNASLPPVAQITYDMALRPKGGHSGYPYVLVQVFPPARTHLSAWPSESQFNSIVQQFSRGSQAVPNLKPIVESIKNDQQREWTKGFMEEIAKSKITSDTEHRTFATIIDGPIANGKPVTGMAVWRFASDGTLVQFNCYAWSAEFEKNRADFARVVSSFKSGI